MNKTLKYFTMLLIPAMTLILGSCTEEYDYIGTKVEGEQVYFSSELAQTIELSATESSITVPVNRMQSSGELTVPLTVNIPEGSSLTVSDQVTFADGETEAYITVSYDPNTIEYGKYDEVTISIKDAEYTTPYGSSSYTFNAGLSEWVKMDGTATFRDGLFTSMYDIDMLTYQVEIEENVLNPGIYRLVNPYGAATDWGKKYLNDDYFTASSGDHYIVINATDPDFVYVDGAFDPGAYNNTADEGPMIWASMVTLNMSLGGWPLDELKSQHPEFFGKLEDNVFTFPTNSLFCEFGTELTGSGYYLNVEGMFTVALPGSTIKDYSATFTYTGRHVDANNESYLQGTITLGSDVASAKYVLAADGDDVNAYVEGILDGSVEATEITESGNISIPLEDGGYYTMIIVTYDAEGEVQGTFATEFAYRGQTSQAVWKPLYVGNMNYGYPVLASMGIPAFYDSSMNHEAIIYQNASLPGEYKLEPYAEAEEGMIFRVKADNSITFDVETGSQVKLVDSETGSAVGPFDVYAQDLDTYMGQYTGTCMFDGNMFMFGTAYYTEMGIIAASMEMFQITGPATTSTASAIAKLPTKTKSASKTFKVKLMLKKTVKKANVHTLIR